MAGRQRHSAEEIVRNCALPTSWPPQGLPAIAAGLGISAATLDNWRRQDGGMDTDAAKELEELREQNAKLERLLADAALEKDVLREIARGSFQARRPSGGR